MSSALLTVGLLLPSGVSAVVPGVNSLASVSSSGIQGNDDSTSSGSSVSGDGRYTTFYSSASNLVSGDTNGRNDVFVRDSTAGTTSLVSVSSTGVQSNASSIDPAMSYDGRYVVFVSNATNLVSGVTDGNLHIYLHDMGTGSTSVVDTAAGGTLGNGQSDYPDVSADGRFVVFQSTASNLVSGSSGGRSQIYAKDTSTGSIDELSVGSGGSEGNDSSMTPRISCDGGVVAFQSRASNLVSGDTNGYSDVFVDSLGWSGNNLADVTLSGNSTSQNPDVSCNGNVIVYDTNANNIVAGLPSGSQSVLEYNRLSSSTSIASANSSGAAATGISLMPSVSDDGRYVAFLSNATTGLDATRSYDIFGNQQQTYIKDMKTGLTQVLSIDVAGNGTSGSVDALSISSDGSIVAYDSVAEGPTRGLVASDGNGHQDVFMSETGL